jgi:hypothetical protein
MCLRAGAPRTRARALVKRRQSTSAKLLQPIADSLCKRITPPGALRVQVAGAAAVALQCCVLRACIPRQSSTGSKTTSPATRGGQRAAGCVRFARVEWLLPEVVMHAGRDAVAANSLCLAPLKPLSAAQQPLALQLEQDLRGVLRRRCCCSHADVCVHARFTPLSAGRILLMP